MQPDQHLHNQSTVFVLEGKAPTSKAFKRFGPSRTLTGLLFQNRTKAYTAKNYNV